MTQPYKGALFIGDPHLASRVPGFRKDDYPRTILAKLTWSFNYALEHQLLPAILGDLFHWPRDNSNRMVVRLLQLFRGTVLGVAGNHDCKENELGDDDALSILSAAGRLRLLEQTGPWVGPINGRTVVIGGSAWGQPLPVACDPTEIASSCLNPLVIWPTHHDIKFPGDDDAGRFATHEIPGIDIVVNGHLHRPLADVVVGRTTWLNPGNIARVSRGDAVRSRRPSLLRLDVYERGWQTQMICLPFQPYEEVFHDEIVESTVAPQESVFVRGLAALESLKTYRGAGLSKFLDDNLGQFDPRVVAEIRFLEREVCDYDS